MVDSDSELKALVLSMQRQVNELNSQLIDLRSQVRLLDMNNAEDLKELFEIVQNIKDQFNQNSPSQEAEDERQISANRKSSHVKVTPGKTKSATRLAAVA